MDMIRRGIEYICSRYGQQPRTCRVQYHVGGTIDRTELQRAAKDRRSGRIR